MGFRYPHAKQKWQCRVCEGWFTRSAAYERAGLPLPKVCATCRTAGLEKLPRKMKVKAKRWFPGRVIAGVKTVGDWTCVDGPDGMDVGVNPGDWIVTYNNALYVVPPDVFSKLYAELSEAA